jgi:phosphoglycolate phosphatase
MIDAGLRFNDRCVGEQELTRLHDAFLAFYAAHVAVASRPFPGVIEVLDRLRAGGAHLAVCTNKVEALSKLLLRTLSLESRFGVIAGRDTFPVCKPAPGHLTGAIARVGGRPDRAVMVGDSEVDFATAMAANIPSIGVTFGYTPRPVQELGADVVIGSYRDFMPALERLLPR